jgi:outer membrane protein assembly factor BamD (BamD/ComL family)
MLLSNLSWRRIAGLSARVVGKRLAVVIISLLASSSLFAQLETVTADVEKDKPKKFQNKVLKSEKTGDKKFTITRKFINNTAAHYNYYYNADQRLKAVVERAIIANKENYAQLLPFYNYSFDATAAQANELDSVIYKSTAGILLHDLRNSWVDDLYMLVGQAYYYRKEFDSASMTFQFINYNLYPKTKKSDDNQLVGSSNEKSTALSIANPEKKPFLGKKPVRNDALLWQAKTLIEMEQYPDAAGLINTLQNDPNFPPRLKTELEEVNAYWFYKQKLYDSAVTHLVRTINKSESKTDRGRREFMIAQLYELTGHPAYAYTFYGDAAIHTTDPLLEIYANLNSAKMSKGGQKRDINDNINELLRMARRDKYDIYRDVIFYAAGELALQKGDTAQAEMLYKKSIKNNIANSAMKNKAFLRLANLAYDRQQYKNAGMFYDSLQLTEPAIFMDTAMISMRKSALKDIVEQITIIEREDSLQRIAAMPAAEREAFLKAMLKKIRKQKGLKDEAPVASARSSDVFTDKNVAQQKELFADNTSTAEWYFYNNAAKAKGFNDFQRIWGKRSNMDNWRRKKASEGAANIGGNPDEPSDVLGRNSANDKNSGAIEPPQNDISTMDGLLTGIPLSPELVVRSNANVSGAMFKLGSLYQNSLEDYPMAITTYEKLVQRYPDSAFDGKLYLDLYYSYLKIGNQQKADYYKNLLTTRYTNTKSAQMLLNPSKFDSASIKAAATRRYEVIYNYFVEGNFDKALQEKKAADSLFGNTYWTPQLLYIEGVYYVKQRLDSQAINTFNQIIKLYPNSKLKPKAVTFIDVLKRRAEIEKYLTNLNEKPKNDTAAVARGASPGLNVGAPGKDMNDAAKGVVIDAKAPYKIADDQPQMIAMVLEKVDQVYVGESKNALNRAVQEKYSGKGIEVSKDALDKETSLILFKGFNNSGEAIKFMLDLRTWVSGEVSWLSPSKYRFIMISEDNLKQAKANKNMNIYLEVLRSRYPGKF